MNWQKLSYKDTSFSIGNSHNKHSKISVCNLPSYSSNPIYDSQLLLKHFVLSLHVLNFQGIK